nr:MAG TPA: hypothetical protein [Caudoviricetes sp.]
MEGKTKLLKSNGKPKLENMKNFDFYNMQHSSSANYKAIRLFFGYPFGDNNVSHKYLKYNLIPNTSDTLAMSHYSKYTGCFRYYHNSNIYDINMLTPFFVNMVKTEREYIYEVIPKLETWYNEIKIPVYIDKEITPESQMNKDDVLKALLNMEIEIRYLEKSNIERYSNWNFDSFAIFSNKLHNRTPHDYKYDTPYWDTLEPKIEYKKRPMHKYAFTGYNRFLNTADAKPSYASEGGLELTDFHSQSEYSNIFMTSEGRRSKFSRHRNSTGNHIYKSKLTFMNTVDTSLRAASIVASNLYRLYPSQGGFYGYSKYIFTQHDTHNIEELDSLDIRYSPTIFVTHLDMYQGIHKSMIAANINEHYNDTMWYTENKLNIDSNQVMTYIQNYPTVNITFEESLQKTSPSYTNNDSITHNDTPGVCHIGYIRIGWYNFDEIGLGRDDNYKEKRTCDDYSENSRFLVKLKIAKRDINLLYKGQTVKGDSIFLGKSYINTSNEKIFTEKPLLSAEKYQHVFLRSGAAMTQIYNTHYSNKDKMEWLFETNAKKYGYDATLAKSLFTRFTRFFYTGEEKFNVDTNTNQYPFHGNYYTEYNVPNLGGWMLPPIRFSNIYDYELSENKYPMSAPFNFRTQCDGKDRNIIFPQNTGLYGLCACEYISLNPVLMNKFVHI